MRRFILRLDDACETMDRQKWKKMEKMLDKYNIQPLVGVVPHNEDENLIIDDVDCKFWDKVSNWKQKNWEIALHGYNHVYISENPGINPIHRRSEFAGVSYKIQTEKIKQGYQMLLENGIQPRIFIAPSHTFDITTLEILKKETDINIISDTVANDLYYKDKIFFIPQQTGRVRNLPFKLVTFCYHPNTMTDSDFIILERFLQKHKNKFICIKNLKLKKRKENLYDKILRYLYFKVRRKND